MTQKNRVDRESMKVGFCWRKHFAGQHGLLALIRLSVH